MANEKRLDLINKWDVVNKLIQLENNYQFYKEKWDADVLYRRICELEIGIGKAPTVDAVEVVHGRWIVCGDGEYVPFMCSACGKTTSWYHAQTANYCPNCGADMRERKDNG